MNGSAILIRYRNESGFATLDVHKMARPVITPLPALELSHNTEVIDNTGLPVLVATVSNVKQTLWNQNTGTQFLLSHGGITVVRRPQVEQEYATGQLMVSGN